jgi:hypothetical protein
MPESLSRISNRDSPERLIAFREIERIDGPSQSIRRIWTRLANGSLFMLPCGASSRTVHFIARRLGLP